MSSGICTFECTNAFFSCNSVFNECVHRTGIYLLVVQNKMTFPRSAKSQQNFQSRIRLWPYKTSVCSIVDDMDAHLIGELYKRRLFLKPHIADLMLQTESVSVQRGAEPDNTL